MARLEKNTFCLCFAVLIACGLPCAVIAAESSDLWESHFKLGLELNSFSYTEPDVMEEEGYLVGLSGSMERHIRDNIRYMLSGSLVFGNLEYDGYIFLDDGLLAPIEVTTPNYIFNLRGICGPLLGSRRFYVAPYLGLGWRFLVDDLEEASAEYGYIREQTYMYLPLGVECRHELSSGWRVSGVIEYDAWLFGQNYSHGGALGSGVTLDQESGSGFRASAGITAPRSGGRSFDAIVFYERWDVDDSEINGGFLEPQNHSNLIGLRVSVCFY